MTKRKITLLSIEDINIYDWDKTKEKVRNYFAKYRNYMSKINMIESRYSCSLSEDNFGIFSSMINDPVLNKIEQMDKYHRYIDQINMHLKM